MAKADVTLKEKGKQTYMGVVKRSDRSIMYTCYLSCRQPRKLKKKMLCSCAHHLVGWKSFCISILFSTKL